MTAFKTVNGLLFVVLGIAIVYRVLQYSAHAGAWFELIPGLILGAAMFALGVHRTLLVVRARR
jgi:uncharacterized membrane protein